MSLDNITIPITKPIVFFHIPKTAGTNFTYIIENNYKSHCAIMSKQFCAQDKKTGKKVCYWGHAGFVNACKEESVMFVFLRNPVERVISHFVEHRNNRYVNKDFTLEEMFLKRPADYFDHPTQKLRERAGMHNACWASNFYCRALTGNSFYGELPIASAAMKDEIVENISNNKLTFTDASVPVIFGITERFKESCELFARVAGWKTTSYEEKSASRAWNKGKRRYDASPKLCEVIAEYNKLDLEIYSAACSAFDRQLAYFKDRA